MGGVRFVSIVLLCVTLGLMTQVESGTPAESQPLSAAGPIMTSHEGQPLLTPLPRPLKICVLVEPCPITYVSGLSVRFQSLLAHLSTCTEDHVQLITAEAVHKDPPAEWHGVPVQYTNGMSCWPLYPEMTVPVDWTFRALRCIRRMRPDLIHVSSPGWFVLSAWIGSRIWGIPLVMSYHTHLPHYMRAYLPTWLFKLMGGDWTAWQIIRLMHSLADLTVVTSPQILEEFRQHGIIAHESDGDCEVWPKGVDMVHFHPKHYNETMRQKMSDGHVEDLLILCIGRLAKEKRWADLPFILDNLPDYCRVCIVGSGPMESELRQLLARHASRVVFSGQQTGIELQQAYASADVMCMPSDSETLGFVVMESMASGVPCVAARAGGIPDLIHDEVTGFLVPPGDSAEFADRLLQLHHHPSQRKAMARAARGQAEQWSWDASMTKLRCQFYSKAMSNYHERRAKRRSWLGRRNKVKVTAAE